MTDDIQQFVSELGVDIEPSAAPSHYKGLANKNVQSATFRMLQKALERGGRKQNQICEGFLLIFDESHERRHLKSFSKSEMNFLILLFFSSKLDVGSVDLGGRAHAPKLNDSPEGMFYSKNEKQMFSVDIIQFNQIKLKHNNQ